MPRNQRSHGAKAVHSASRSSAKGGTVLGIFIGLVVGILVSLAVVWYMNNTPTPFVERVKPPTAGPVTIAPPAALPGKPGDLPAEKRFQFYDILPGKADPQPEVAATVGAPKTAPAKATGPLSLQVAAFEQLKDADNLRARLTLMGVEPTVQEVKVNEKTWYRVRIGPIPSFEELNRLKADLAKQGMQAAVVKSGE